MQSFYSQWVMLPPSRHLLHSDRSILHQSLTSSSVFIFDNALSCKTLIKNMVHTFILLICPLLWRSATGEPCKEQAEDITVFPHHSSKHSYHT